MAKYYPRWVGSIQKKTGHLSCAELGVYDRLLDHYYSAEIPLPGDVESCARIARAMTRDERKAVESVLRQFFTLNDGEYRQERVDIELDKMQELRLVSQSNGKKGGRPKNPDGSGSKPSRIKNKNTDETYKKPTGFSAGYPAGNPELTQSESYTETDTEKHISVESESVIDIPPKGSPPDKKLTHSLTPVEVFPMTPDWCPGIAFELGLPFELRMDNATVLRDLQEFVLYRIGTGERYTQAQWEHKYLQNLEANKRHREASCA